jgi:hypothetical protein
MTDFTDRLHELTEELYESGHRTLALYCDKSDLEIRMHEIDELIAVSREVGLDILAELRKLVADRVVCAGEQVDEYIDRQLQLHLCDDVSTETVVCNISEVLESTGKRCQGGDV